MGHADWLAPRFEENRSRLRGVAYRMLGSIPDADDAVQDTWLRLARADAGEIENLSGWLTTVIARVCMDQLRSRGRRRFEVSVAEPIVSREGTIDPEQAALLGDWIGLALLVVVDTLAPAERIAFVLHDVFGVPFDAIAPVVERTPAAARQLASRARRRVKGAPVPDDDLGQQRVVVDAFFAAVRAGDFEALLAVLDPDVVVRADFGGAPGGSRLVRGARAVADQSLTFAQFAAFARPALVNGAAGIVAGQPGRPYAVMGFTVRGGRIVEIDILADAVRLRQLDWAGLAG